MCHPPKTNSAATPAIYQPQQQQDDQLLIENSVAVPFPSLSREFSTCSLAWEESCLEELASRPPFTAEDLAMPPMSRSESPSWASSCDEAIEGMKPFDAQNLEGFDDPLAMPAMTRMRPLTTTVDEDEDDLRVESSSGKNGVPRMAVIPKTEQRAPMDRLPVLSSATTTIRPQRPPNRRVPSIDEVFPARIKVTGQTLLEYRDRVWVADCTSLLREEYSAMSPNDLFSPLASGLRKGPGWDPPAQATQVQ